MGILVVQLVYPNTMNYQILVICLTKFYSNSVVVCLNLRASNVNGAGRHTMLTGFHTNEEFTSSRVPFDVKVEKFTSSGVMASSGFHSDPVSNSSDYGLVEEARHVVDHLYPVSIHTKPLNIGPYRSNLKEKSSFAAVSEVQSERPPFQSTDNLNTIKYLPSIHSTLSTKASRGHDQDSVHTTASPEVKANSDAARQGEQDLDQGDISYL
jgi:hypothetical protein